MKPTEKKILVIGGGVWGQKIVRTLHRMNRLEGVVDLNPNTRAYLERQLFGLAALPTLPTKLSPHSTAIVICTPAVTHFKLASQMLREGYDVFVEKPIAMNSQEASELNQLAQKHKSILMVGHVFLYSEAIQYTAKLLKGNRIGKLHHVHFERKNWGRIRKDENIVWSLAPHDFSILLHLFGEVPRLESARGRSFYSSERVDQVVADFAFPSGLGVTLSLSWLWPEKVRRISLFGSAGLITCDSQQETVSLYPKIVTEQDSSPRLEPELLFRSTRPALDLEMEAFCESLRTRRQPVSNGEHAIKVVSLVEDFDRGVAENLRNLARRVA